MPSARAADVLERFAALGTRVEGRPFFSLSIVRRLIAASTEGELAIGKLYVASAGSIRVLTTPDLSSMSTWAAAVFRANGAALAEVDRLTASAHDALCAAELMSRAGYYSGRSHLPPAARSDEELAWHAETLDAALGTGAAMGAPAPEAALLALAAVRAELVRRGVG